jgi:type I restriction enzyme, S subunit
MQRPLVRPASELDKRYVGFFFQSPSYRYQISRLSSGVSINNLRREHIEAMPFPLSPLAEQYRIVTKIEELLSDLNAGVAELQKTKAQLKRYRHAVLKAAVEGKLTAGWREAHRGAIDTAEKTLANSETILTRQRKRAGRLWGSGFVPDLTDGERAILPTGWTWAKVRELGTDPEDTVQVGPMSMRSKDFVSSGVPVLNVGCVHWGYFNEMKLDFLPVEIAAGFERYRIQSGDVLFTRSGTVGRCAVAGERQDGWLMTFHLLRVRPSQSKCLSEYLRMVFEGAGHIRRQTREASIGTTRAGFNTNLLAMLDVPVPPLAEQEQILAEVDRRLSVADEIEQVVDQSLKQAERLRQSILKRAFAGKLVPQDPSDEPAEMLLERIRAQRTPTVKLPTQMSLPIAGMRKPIRRRK